jgi:uncharacterized protein
MQKTLYVLVLLVSNIANAASFDCAKAKTPQEKAICTDPALSAADDEMAAAYRAALAVAPKEMVAEIREGQRAWVRSAASRCPCSAYAATSGLALCLKYYENDRTRVLRNMIVQKSGITFVWKTLILSEPGSRSVDGSKAEDSGDNSGPGTLNASWPEAMDGSPEWQAWNKAMDAAVPKDLAPDTDIDFTAALGHVTASLVTATMDDTEFGHMAAHPNTNSIQFNWLLKQQRRLRADDVFLSDSGWDSEIQERCEKSLRKELGADYESYLERAEMAKVLHDIVIKPENWELTKDGLAVIFPVYAVACRACTPRPVKILWSDLRPFLKPDFEIRN